MPAIGITFQNAGFRVVDHNREVLFENRKFTGLDDVLSVVPDKEKLCILQLPCPKEEGNKCDVPWHDAILVYRGSLWIMMESLMYNNPMPLVPHHAYNN